MKNFLTSFLIFILLKNLVLSQIEYSYDILNNTVELKLIDSKNHFLISNISSYNIGDIVHIFIKIPTRWDSDDDFEETLKYFTLTEDYINIEDITIPDNIQNITSKYEKDYFFYRNYYIDFQIKSKTIKYLIILIHNKIEDKYGYAMITDLDQSQRKELNIKDNITYNFNDNPLLIIFNMKDYNHAYFKLNSKYNIFENYEIKYTHFLHSTIEFTTFQSKNYTKLKKEQCYIIKNGENNYTIYFNFIHNSCCTSYAFIIKAFKKEELSIESLYYSFMQNIYINDFTEEKMVNSIVNNLGLGIISPKSLTGNYIFFTILQKYNEQRSSNDISFYYSLSNNNYTFEEKNLNLISLEYNHKELDNLNNIYYCQINLNNYNSSRLLLYFLGGGGLFIRISQLYEWIIPLNLYSKYTNLFRNHRHYSIGIGDLIENENYYFKIIVYSLEKVDFNTYLINQSISNISEVKEPLYINIDYFSLGIDNEQIYYFCLKNSNYNNSKSLTFDILSYKDNNITLENTKNDENISEYYNLEKYENKTILFNSKNLFLTLNISTFEKGEKIYMNFEALSSAFNNYIIYYNMNDTSDKTYYLTSEKCMNFTKNSKIYLYCNYTKNENNFLNFLLFLNPNNSIFIQNSKKYYYNETTNNKKKSKNLILLIILIFIIILILIFTVLFFMKKKKKNNSVILENKKEHIIHNELKDSYSLNN